jgi:nitroreductase
MEQHMDSFEIVSKIIKKRRTFKPAKLTDRIISRSTIEKIIENAKWAPSHGFTEPWHFVIFSGESRGELADFQSKLYKEHHRGEKFNENKYERLKINPMHVSHIIAICMKAGRNEKIPVIEEIEAVACAVQNMHLSATALGIGAIWSTGFITYQAETKAFLNLSEKDQCLGFFYLGYPEDEKWPKSKRKDIAEITEWR